MPGIGCTAQLSRSPRVAISALESARSNQAHRWLTQQRLAGRRPANSAQALTCPHDRDVRLMARCAVVRAAPTFLGACTVGHHPRRDGRIAQTPYDQRNSTEFLGAQMKMTVSLERTLNIVALLGVLVVLSGSLLLQFGDGEQPCPLCLVQRSGMIGLAIGPAMNLLWGLRPRHYAISILAALVGGAGSTRQILLHIATPGDQGFGPAVLGFHLYTWADITFVAAIGLIAVIMLFDRPLMGEDKGLMRAATPSFQRLIAFAVVAWVAMYAVIIAIAVIPECGIGMCPDNPEPGVSIGFPLAIVAILVVALISLVIGIRANRTVRR